MKENMETQTALYEDEDVVLSEIDVFLSTALSEKLHVFHYPTKAADSVDEDLTCLAAKVKPKQKKVNLEFGLNVHSLNYDRSKGEQIAYNVDRENENPFFQSSTMDKYMLRGTEASGLIDSYAIALINKGEVNLTPVHAILEMCPDFHYVDKMEKESKKGFTAEDEEDEDEEAVAVTMRFEGPYAERDRQRREKSFQHLQQKNAREAWVEAEYYNIDSTHSAYELEKLKCTQKFQSSLHDTLSHENYIAELVPDCLRLSGCDPVTEESVPLKNKPLTDQIRHLLINAHVLRFDMLLEKLPPGVDVLTVEKSVQHSAVLVQGCWAVKSDVLYQIPGVEDPVSPLTGITMKLLINVRDYVLWLFTKSRFITREEVLSKTYVPNEDFMWMIRPLANNTNRGWEFKYPYDAEFVDSHPGIEQSQEIRWNLRCQKLVKELDLRKSDLENHQPAPKPSPTKPRQKRVSHSSISEGDESGTDSCSSKDRPPAKRTYNTKKRAASATGGKAFQIATLDISPTFLDASAPEAARAELREYVGDVLRAQYVVPLAELRELVSVSPLQGISRRPDFERLLVEAVEECGATKLKNKWPQNTSPQTLYAFTKYGNKLDRYRAMLLDLFSTTARARVNLFVKKVEDELREIVSEADCKQIFEEYCVHKSGFYYLKGTIPLDT